MKNTLHPFGPPPRFARARSALGAASLGLLAAACSSSSSSAAPDATPADARPATARDAAADHAKPPSGAADAGKDATKQADARTGAPDSHPVDAYGVDSHVVDSHVADSYVADSYVADSHVADSYVADSHVADSHVADSHAHARDAQPARVEAGARDAGEDAIPDARPDTGPAAFFDGGPGCAVGPMGEPVDLKCTGLYADWDQKTVASDVLPYAPGIWLWSDGAWKNRWISLPQGKQIDTSNMDEWKFPVGTRLFKEFDLPTSTSDGGLRRIETRVLWKLTDDQPVNWYLTTYRWTEDGETDATELTTGQVDANGLGYEVPPQQDCTLCHQGRVDDVMGFEAVLLAHPDATGLAMPELIDAGLLTDPPEAGSLTIPGDPTAASALGFLHVNCGVSCHNENSSAAAYYTRFDMRLDHRELTSVQTTDTWTSGWNKPSGLPIPGVASTDLLAACSTETSAAYYFADHRDGVDGYTGVQMPIVATHVVDDAGMQILAAWLNADCDAGVGDAAP